MLTPSYLLHAVEPAEEIAEQLHQDILNRIIERILIRFKRGDNYILTATDKWNIELLQEAGFLLEDVQKELSEATGKMQTEIAEAMEDAGVRALEYDDKIYRQAGLNPMPLVQSPKLIAIMQRDYEATMGEWVNFTRVSSKAAHKLFINACDTAYHQAMTGMISTAQAVKEAIEVAAEAGVYVEYKDKAGNVLRRDTIETATTRAVRTGISQASGNIQTARMDEFDVDLVLVSSHLGARPEHAVWQGKIYSRSGTSEEYPDFVSSTGYGSVTGLCGANCRHNFGPWFEGMENPFEQYDSEENQKQYELEQRQRTLERRIRDTKRKTMNWKTAMDAETDPAQKAIFEAEYQRKAALLQRQNKAYREYCKDNDLRYRDDRISIAKWDRKQAAKARAAAKRRIEDIGESAAVSNWHTIPVAGGQSETKYRMLDGAKTIDENAAAVNPGYQSGKPEYRNNCQRCVPAYEMRRRGYDVVAKPAVVDETGELSPRDPLYTKWKNVFQNAKFTFCSGYDKGKSEIIQQMEAWGDGAVAEVRVLWKDNKAHVFVAEMNGGTVKFIDPQNGKECENYFTDAALGGTMIARIDNLEPSSLIELCIKNRGGK